MAGFEDTLKSSPYYDRYVGDSAHKSANYTRVLAQPGRAEQASEFNEIQSIARDYTERLGNAVLKDGYVVSGIVPSISDTVLTLTAGKIFLSGLVRNTNAVTLHVNSVGMEYVVAYVTESIVTYANDTSLRDPAQGAQNYNMIGADRAKEDVNFAIVTDLSNAPEGSAQVYAFSDGILVKDTDTNQYDFINDILAERTYDENGNYKVNGLDIQKAMEIDGDQIRVYVSSGKAYVKGYEVSKSNMSSVLLDAAVTDRLVQSESHYYKSTSNTYELSNTPVKTISNFTCLVSVLKEKHYRGSIAGGAESLTNTPVDSISKVYTLSSSGTVETTYVQGRDYNLYNDQIDWSPTGDNVQEPSPGTTYYVDYVYNKSMVEGTDYSVTNDSNSSYITFLSNGDKPDQNSRMYISYYYTLARRDLILLDKDGNLSVLKGTPAKYSELMTPYNGSTSYIELGYVTVFAKDMIKGSLKEEHLAEVTNYDSVRVTQDSMLTMMRRIDYLENSVAQLDMERSVEAGADLTSLGGYFTDDFDSINKSDIGYVDSKNNISYDCCIDYDRKELTTAANISSYDLTVDSSSSDSYAVYGDVISAPYTFGKSIEQSWATGTYKVNPYASYGPMCKVTLNPAKDNWVDTKTIKVYNTIENQTYTTDTKVYSHGFWSRNANKNLRGYIGTTTNTTTTYTGTTTRTDISDSVAKTLIEYMRVKQVKVTGEAFGANQNNISCTFNGKPIDIIASGTSSQGSTYSSGGKNYKTIRADANGTFTGYFTVPEKTPCGNVPVVFSATNNLGEKHTGQATYSAVGTLLTDTITNTKVVTDHYKVLIEVDNIYKSDPLAQSFIMDTVYDRNLMKLDLYFATKSTTRPVIVQIRNMVNGYPGETVYAEVSIKSEDVNIPTNKNVPVATSVVLNQPVYCYAGRYYCFCVLSDSNDYSMYYAQMGKNRLGTTNPVVVNPYATGVMFSSSNASTWTAHQDSDLMFTLYRSVYTGSGEIIFNNVSAQDATGIFLDAAYEVDSDNNSSNSKTGLTWYYRFMDSRNGNSLTDWLGIDTLTYRDFQSTTSRISLKAVITTDFSTSPFIDSGRVSLRSFTDGLSATYISKHLTESDFYEPYKALKITYQAALPSGSSHKVYYMDTSTGTWNELVTDANTVLTTSVVDEEFTQYTWNVKKIHKLVADHSSNGATFFKLRIGLQTNIRYNRPRIRKLACIFKYETA